jgi:hypothetical protein
MSADLTIKQGDTLPVLTDTLTYSDGSSPNLAGATVNLVVRQLTAATPVVNAAATVTNATSPATLQFAFTSGQTAVAGMYVGTWVVTFAGGQVQTFPTVGELTISIEENLTTSGGQTIVDLASVKEYLNIGATDRSRDAKLTRFIRASVPVIESLVGNVVQRSYEEWYDGGQHFIRLRNRPVVQLIACSEYRGPIEYPLVIIASPDKGEIFSCELDGGRVVRRTAGGGVIAFPAMPQSVHVVYVTGRNPVPLNIVEGNLELLRVNYQRTQQAGRPGIGGGPSNSEDEVGPTVATGFFVPGRVKEMLAPHRRAPRVA